MATRKEKCICCSTKLRVPVDTQSIQCPACGSVIVVSQRNSAYTAPPATNQYNGYYQQPLNPLARNRYKGYYQQPSSPPRANQYNYSYQQPLQTPATNQYNGSYLQPWPTSPQPLSQVSPYPAQNNGYNWQSSQIAPQVSPSPVYGKKRAVICGMSYLGQKTSLKGSVNDAISMRKFLLNMTGFPNASLLVLVLTATKNYVYYSGHASRTKDLSGDEMDGYDELLCPVDYKTARKISDDEINATLVHPLPRGAKLHAITDTCFSGTMVDLPFVCRMNWQEQVWEDHRVQYGAYKGTSGGLAISISACDDHQNSGDTTAFTGDSAGALTYSFIHSVENEPNLTYGILLNSMRDRISEAQQRLGATTVLN